MGCLIVLVSLLLLWVFIVWLRLLCLLVRWVLRFIGYAVWFGGLIKLFVLLDIRCDFVILVSGV